MKKHKNLYVVLGAPDHEMNEIQRICVANKIRYTFATKDGWIVKTFQAYDADSTLREIPSNAKVVTVECNVIGLSAWKKIDHHREGDAGFGKSPDNYLEGSSLGQFLELLELTPTPAQRVIAAADHCLTAAYQGKCPGVDVDDLRSFRESSRAKSRGITVEELVTQINEASVVLKNSQKTILAGTPVAIVDNIPAEIAEASAREAIPYIVVRKEFNGDNRSSIRSASVEVVKAFIKECGLVNIYGDPQRGFAGGYFPT